MTTPEPPEPQTPQAPPQAKPNAPKQKLDFKPLGTVRDYFAVQMEQDASFYRR